MPTKYAGTIEFTGDFGKVVKEALPASKKVAYEVESAYGRVLRRLTLVQGNLGRVAQRMATDVGARIGGVKGVIGGVKGVATNVAGALTSGVSVAAAAIGGVVEKADKLSKLKSMDATTYQRLAIAAEQGGTTIEDVEKASLALNVTLAKAKLPAEFGAAMSDAGLSAKQLKGLNPEEQFRLIADALQTIVDPGERARVAMILMGGSMGSAGGIGKNLVPMLSAGGDAIKQIGDTAQEQGRIISAETIAAGASSAAAFTAMTGPIAGLIETLLTTVVPPLTEALGGIVGFLTQNKEAISEAMTVVMSIVERAVAFITKAIEILMPVFDAIVEQAGRIIDVFLTLFSSMSGEGGSVLDTFIETLAEWLVPIITLLGDTVVWLVESVITPLVTILVEVFTLLGAVWEQFSFLGTIVGVVIDVLGNIATVVNDVLGGAFRTVVEVLRTVISLFNVFTTGKWSEAFMALGNALLDFILQPLRDIVATVISIADAISDDLVPDSIRSFAEGGGIRKLASDAGQERLEAASAVETVTNNVSSNVSRLESEGSQYGPAAPSKAKRGTGKGKGKDKDDVIKIAARGITYALSTPKPGKKSSGMEMSKPPADTSTTTTIAVAKHTASAIAIAPIPLPHQNVSDGNNTFNIGGVQITIAGADLSDPGATAKAVASSAETAVLRAINRGIRQLEGRKRS